MKKEKMRTNFQLISFRMLQAFSGLFCLNKLSVSGWWCVYLSSQVFILQTTPVPDSESVQPSTDWTVTGPSGKPEKKNLSVRFL